MPSSPEDDAELTSASREYPQQTLPGKPNQIDWVEVVMLVPGRTESRVIVDGMMVLIPISTRIDVRKWGDFNFS
jgi:hypothetical protein